MVRTSKRLKVALVQPWSKACPHVEVGAGRRMSDHTEWCISPYWFQWQKMFYFVQLANTMNMGYLRSLLRSMSISSYSSRTWPQHSHSIQSIQGKGNEGCSGLLGFSCGLFELCIGSYSPQFDSGSIHKRNKRRKLGRAVCGPLHPSLRMQTIGHVWTSPETFTLIQSVHGCLNTAQTFHLCMLIYTWA